MRFLGLIVVVCIASLSVSGCATKAKVPEAKSGLQYEFWINEKQLLKQQGELARSFHDLVEDKNIRALIHEAQAHNLNLAVAVKRVNGLHELYRAQNRDRLPDLELIASAERAKQPGLLEPIHSIENQKRAGISLRWEIDLWGRLAAKTRSKKAEWRASAWDVEGAKRSLSAEVIRHWLLLTSTSRQQEIQQRRIEFLSDINEIRLERFAKGVGSYASLAETQEAINRARAELLRLENDKQFTWSALAQLLGRGPSSVEYIPTQLPELVDLHVQAPSSVLANRPDVQSAWQQYLASTEERRAQHRALLPQLVIDASATKNAARWSGLDSATTIWNMVGGTSFRPAFLPFLSAAANRDLLRAAELEQDAQWLRYKSVVLQALHEVEDLLASEQFISQQLELSEQALSISTALVDEQKSRFTNGIGGIQSYLNAQLNQLDAELYLLNLQAKQIENRINLALALGLELNTNGLSTEEGLNNV